MLRFSLFFALGLTVAAAAEVSPLHPRIFVRHDKAALGTGLTVSQLRARRKDPAYERWRGTVSGRGAVVAVERAARYLEDGNAADLAAVRDFLKTNTFSYEKHDVGGFLAGAEMATAFDWVYDGLTDEDRRSAMANIVTTAESSRRFLERGGPDINHNYTYMALATVAICGLALHSEPEPYGSTALKYLELSRRFLEAPGMVLDTWHAREGAWAEGSHYTFHETLRNLVLMLAAYRTASDLDYFAVARKDHGDFLARAGRFLIACTRPDFTFERIGDCSPSRAMANITVPVTVEMLAWGLGDHPDAARLRSFGSALQKTYGEKAVHPAFGWGMRIFHDPRARQTPSFRTLPLAMRMGAGTYDQIVLRSGWNDDSTQITILAGDHFTDHQHFDKGHFLIYKRGGLTVDGGAYDQMYKAGGHWNEYAVRTLAHNCLLVYDPDQSLPKGHTNDGGQIVLRGKQHHDDWPAYVAHREKEGLDTANVTAFDAGDGYSYVRVDLTPAYGPKVTRYSREFVYLLAQDLLVVLDRVTAARADFRKRWLLHFQERPEVDGAAPETGVTEFKGGRLTTVHRRGEADLGGKPVTYDGTLFIHTLLPEQRVVSVIGGPGYEYFNSFFGVNYPTSRPAVAPEARESGNWRIEVAPERPAQDDLFLHAIQVAGGLTGAPVEARPVKALSDGLAGVQFLSRPENQIVLLSSDASGGTVALPMTYEVDSDGPTRHIVTGMQPGISAAVIVNGKRLTAAQVNGQSVLSFRDPGKGKRTITIRRP
jgi:Heparinase II/III-like protein